LDGKSDSKYVVVNVLNASIAREKDNTDLIKEVPTAVYNATDVEKNTFPSTGFIEQSLMFISCVHCNKFSLLQTYFYVFL